MTSCHVKALKVKPWGTSLQGNEEASTAPAAQRQPTRACRAASGSDANQGHSVEQCAGDKTHETTEATHLSGALHTTNDGDKSFAGAGEHMDDTFDVTQGISHS